MSKFHCANYKLKIEIGQHKSIPLNDRSFDFSLINNNVVVECEYHVFLFVLNILLYEKISFSAGTMVKEMLNHSIYF